MIMFYIDCVTELFKRSVKERRRGSISTDSAKNEKITVIIVRSAQQRCKQTSKHLLPSQYIMYMISSKTRFLWGGEVPPKIDFTVTLQFICTFHA